MDVRVVTGVYGVLIDASRAAHAQGRYEVAYHALMAAMHEAALTGGESRLREVEREALRQIEWIDKYEPEHRLSTTSSGRHSHPGVYAMLARQATAYAGMSEERALMAKHAAEHPYNALDTASPATPPV